MDDAADGQHVVELSATELAGLERAIPPGPPGGELEPGDAVVSAFDVDCRAVGAGYELVCEPAGFRALVAFAREAPSGLDEDLDEAIGRILDAAEEAG